MEFTMITVANELQVKRTIRTKYPLVVIKESKPWRGEMAYKLSGEISDCINLCLALFTTCLSVDRYDEGPY